MKYKVEVEWSGYSRGVATYLINAESEDEARECYYEGERVKHQVVRDDTEGEVQSVNIEED